MKSHVFALMLIGMLGVIPASAARAANADTSIEEVKNDTQELLQTIGSYTADRRDEAVRKARNGLKRLDRRIDALEAKVDKNWDEMSDAARKQARENLRALREQRNEVAEWYGSMKATSADAWEHMKDGFSDAYESLVDAWGKSEEEFDSSN